MRDRRAESLSAAGATGSNERLNHVLLVILLALIPLRTVVNETHTFESPRLLRALQSPGTVQPATTFTIDAIICAVAGILLVRQFRRGIKPQWTGGELGFVLLAAAALISTIRAGQKHLALIGTIDFLSTLVYFFALRQLLTSPRHIRLALCVLTGTAATIAFKAAWQHFVELPDTIRYFEEHRAELMGPSTNGASPPGFAHDFEMRMRSGAVTGFYGHPNLLASQLIIFITAAASLVVDRLKRHISAAAIAIPALLILALFAVLLGTQSKGAIAACLIGAAFWIGCSLLRRLRLPPGRAVALGWIVAALATVSIVGLLRAKPDALGRSILFRYMYWQGAADMMRELGILGIGADNFGRHFTRFKQVECPEEVESPHSWPVQFATEWGVIGLAGFLFLGIGVSRRAARSPEPTRCDVASRDEGSSTILWISAIFACAFIPWLIIIGKDDSALLALSTGLVALPWFIGTLASAVESIDSPGLPDAPIGPISLFAAAGVIGFLVHTSIDLALFAGGPATSFFALAAILLAARNCGQAQQPPSTIAPTARQPRAAVFAAVILGTSAGGILLWLALPAARVAAELPIARAGVKPSPWEVYERSPAGMAYQLAHAAYPIDATAATEWAEQLFPRVRTLAHSDRAIQLVDEAIARDPDNALIVQQLSQLYQQRFHLTRNIDDLARAVDSYRRCVAAYPTAPLRRIQLAELLAQMGEEMGSIKLRREAADNLRAALEFESRRVYVSQPNRMPPEEIQRIRDRIRSLE